MGRTLARVGWALALVLPLTACGIAPYVDSRREAGQRGTVGHSTPDRVAICYSQYTASPEEIYKMAESACAETGRVPRLEDQTEWSCNLLAPTRIFYRCVPKPEKP